MIPLNRLLTRATNGSSKILRHFSTLDTSEVSSVNQNESAPIKSKKKARIYKRKTTVEKLAERLKIEGCARTMLDDNAKVLARPLRCPEGLYILQSSLAAIVVKYLSTDLRKEKAMVFELNPGPGFVTKGILEAGVPHLRVFEKRKRFLPYLEDLRNVDEGKLEIIEEDFFTLPKLERKHERRGLDTMSLFFKDIKYANWSDEPTLKIFAITPTANEVCFLRFMLRKFVTFDSMFRFGRTQFLLFTSEKEHGYITAQPNDSFLLYRSQSILYQILFDIEVLHKEPRDSFFPPPQKVQKLKKNYYEDNFMFLIRLTPKKHLPDLISPDLLNEFALFVRHNFTQRHGLVSEALNKWIPNSAEKLEAEGISAKLKFGNLTPTQVLTLFLHFSSWPEYNDCLLRTDAQNKWGDNDDFEEADEVGEEKTNE